MAGISAGYPGMPLETNLFPLSLAHFGDTAMFFSRLLQEHPRYICHSQL